MAPSMRSRCDWGGPLARGCAALLGCALGCKPVPSASDAGATAASPPVDFGEGFVNLSADPAFEPIGPIPPEDLVRGVNRKNSAGILVDLDGDGYPELILYVHNCPPTVEPRAYRYDRAARRLRHDPTIALPFPAPMAAADLDGDGHVDLVAANIVQGIAWGLPGGGFSAPAPLLTGDSRCADPNAMHLTDVDQDGLLDLLFGFHGCDRRFGVGPGVRILLNTGDRRFVDRTDLLDTQKQGGSTALYMTTLGRSDRVIVTAASSDCMTGDPIEGTNRQTRIDDAGYPHFAEYVAVPPATGFRRDRVPRSESNLPFISFGSMGFASGDLDGDGLFDLASSLNPWHGVLQALPDGGMVDRTLDISFALIPSVGARRSQIAWGLAFPDLDLDGRQDVIWVHGDDYINDPEFYIGPQAVTAHWNGGGFAFEDVTSALNLGMLGHFMALTVGDLDRDGRPDMIVGGQGTPPQVYLNAISTPNHGFALELRGTTSNRLAMGADVTVLPRDGAPWQRLQVESIASPLSTSQPLVFVGLGDSTKAKTVRITWPSGVVQELHDVPSGGVRVVDEPPSIVLEPGRRRWPADGASVVRVRVLPRALDGTVRTSAQVSLRVRAGTGTLTGPTSTGAGGWVYELRAPTSPGSAQVEASVDGAALQVRPRVWWD